MGNEARSKFLSRERIYPTPLKKDSSAKDLIDSFTKSGAFNAGRLAEARKLYKRMLDEDATIALTLAGAMTPIGMGGAIISLMKSGFLDMIISTGANLYHDLHFALDLPIRQGDFNVDDPTLHKEHIVRIYDIFIPEATLLHTDSFLQEIFTSNRLEEPTHRRSCTT